MPDPVVAPPSGPLTIRDYIRKQSESLGIPADLALAIVDTESGGQHAATSRVGARGFFQLMPETAKELNVDPNDPFQNIDGGLKYFKQQLDSHGGDVRLALAAYNAGPNHQSLQAGQVPAIPETQDYVMKVLRTWQSGGAGLASSRGPTTPGNIDLRAQPEVHNPDGSISTVDSSSYNIDGKEVLLPSVTPDGRHLKTADEIINEYKKTGRHLGMFDSPESATAYAKQLHNDYAAGKYRRAATAPPAFATAGMQPASPTGAKQSAPGNLFESAVVAPVVGFGKQVATSMGDIGRTAERVTGATLPDMPAGDLTQRTLGEKVGGFAEQAGEFALPAGEMTKISKAAGVTQRLIRLGITPSRARLMASALEGGLQAGPAAAIAATHGDDPTSTAILSAAMPVASTMVSNMAPAIRKAAISKMARFMERGVKGDVTPELTRGLAQAANDFIDLPLQRTWRKTAAMTRGVRQQAGETLQSALAGPLGDTPVPKQPIYQALDDLVTDVQHLVPVKGGIRTVTYRPEITAAVDDLKSLLNEYPPDIPARQLHDLKQIWWKSIYPIRESGQPVGAVRELLTSAQKEARMVGAKAVSRVLENDAPDIGALDTAVSHAIKLDQFVKRLATKARSGTLAKPAAKYAASAVGGAAGLAAGSTIGHPFIGAHLGYATSRMLMSAVESPRWRLLPIAARRSLANAIAAGQAETVRKIVTPLALVATADQDDLTSDSNSASASR